MTDNSTAAGATIGGLSGFVKGVMAIQLTAGASLSGLTWGVLLDTAILAFMGGILGWIGAELMKFLKKKITGK
jgi:hypothetical protein